MLNMVWMWSKAAIRGELRWLWEIAHTEIRLTNSSSAFKPHLLR